ncbi:MAG: hypothetical protein RLY93_13445 [Sumerlaeia bacterium]
MSENQERRAPLETAPPHVGPPHTAPLHTRLWDYIERGRAAGGSKLHLRPGAPPLIRTVEAGERGRLAPVGNGEADVAADEIRVCLSLLIEPERWPHYEAMGEGETHVASPRGEFFRVALFRSQGDWSLVIEL